MRAAFDATMKHPEFPALAAKQVLDISQAPGATIQKVVDDMLTMPKSVTNRFSEIPAMRN